MLQYYLRENSLHPDADNYVARVTNLEVVTFEDIKQDITREGSILKDVETEAVVKELFKFIHAHIAKGKAFDSDYFSIVPSIKGTFGKNDHFDKNRHMVMVNMVPGPALRKATTELSAEKVKFVGRAPEPDSISDTATESINTFISGDRMAELTGSDLKIVDLEDPLQGVFLIREDTKEEFRARYYNCNTNTKLGFKVPIELLGGMYQVEVRSTIYPNSKTLQSGVLPFAVELN